MNDANSINPILKKYYESFREKHILMRTMILMF